MTQPVPRLLDTIVPSNYDLRIEFSQASLSFQAQETIRFELVEPSSTLTFHGLRLEIASAKLDEHIASYSSDAAAQTITFTFAQALSAGSHDLHLAFSGPIQDSLHGFYRSSFELDGQPELILMTQFEAIHAREAFVCIDEPAAKAVFEVTLVTDPGYEVLSNTAAVSDTVTEAGQRQVKFSPTPVMSTYLLAWVVSKLAHETVQAASGTPISVYATPQHAQHLSYALDFARRSLDYYEQYFDIAYPLSKLDLVAVPNFASGAMENWGLITYRETDLIVDGSTSLAGKQRVSEVIAHELAHQWFGNLVTMSWWNDLWLNESFASWAETMTVAHLEPAWEWWAQFRAGLGSLARSMDALNNTHAIQVEVFDPRGLDEIFDAISYFKGQSILRMLEGYLGEEVFRTGLRNYLKRYMYTNTVTADLWTSLAEASGKDVAALMDSWTLLPGFPILSYDNQMISQQRFIASPREAAKAVRSPSLWPIPFSAVIPGGNVTDPVLITPTSSQLPEAASSAAWFKPNPGEWGFYRSRYTHEMIDGLREPLQNAELGTTDRFGVVSDVWAGAGAGHISTAAALRLTTMLRAESSYLPALAVYESLGELLSIVEDDGTRQRLEAFGRWLVAPNYERLGWQQIAGEPHFDTLLRPIVLRQAVRFEVHGARESGLEQLANYTQSGALDANIRTAVFYAGARFGDTQVYEQLLDLYRHEVSPHVRQALLVTLGQFRIPALATQTLEFALGSEVRSQDTVYGMAGVWRARENRIIAWKFLQTHWEELVKRFGEGGHMLDRFPDFVGGAFATHAMAQEVESFFAAHPHILITRPVAQAIEAIEFKADWFDRSLADITDFLDGWETSSK